MSKWPELSVFDKITTEHVLTSQAPKKIKIFKLTQN